MGNKKQTKMKAILILLLLSLVAYNQCLFEKQICKIVLDNFKPQLDKFMQECKSELFWSGAWWSAAKLKAAEVGINHEASKICSSRRRLLPGPLNTACKGAVSRVAGFIKEKLEKESGGW